VEEIFKLGCIKLNLFDNLLDHFSEPPRKHLHIVVQLSHDSRKHVDGRKWTVNGAIRENDIIGCYYLDPETHSASTRCLEAVSDCQLALLWGARASGKTTRLLRLKRMLMDRGYEAL